MLVNAIIKTKNDEYFAYIPQIKDFIAKGDSYEKILEKIANENFIESLDLQTLEDVIISLPLELDCDNDIIDLLRDLAEAKKQETYILKCNIPQDKYHKTEGLNARNAYKDSFNEWRDIYEEAIRLENELNDLDYDFRI